MDSKTPSNFSAFAGPRNPVAPDSAPIGPSASVSTPNSNEQFAEAAQGPVLFFDGVCGLCNRFVDFTLTHDRAGRIRFSPLQGETARARLTPADVQSLESVVLVDESGVHRRSSAVVRVLRLLSPGWRIVAGLLWLIPLPLRDFGYKLVAANRYRLFGKKETCRLPAPGETARFLP